MEENFNKEERQYLLKLARDAMKYFLRSGRKMDVKPGDVPSEKLIEDGAAFVTLYIGKQKALRGCIGSLEARKPLVMDIVDNAINAAFGDPRFYPVKEAELKDIKIEISVLTRPAPLKVKDADDLLNKLIPERHGLILMKGLARATFLPAVWKELPKKEDFLAHLCRKAGLEAEEWKNTADMDFFTYEAEEFGEE